MSSLNCIDWYVVHKAETTACQDNKNLVTLAMHGDIMCHG